MLIDLDVLASVRDWVTKAQGSWKGLVTASNFEESPEGRTPRSVSWSLDGSRFMGQIVVWEDGQSELDLIDSIVDDARRRIGGLAIEMSWKRRFVLSETG